MARKKHTPTQLILKLIRIVRDYGEPISKEYVIEYINNNYSINKTTQRKMFKIFADSGLVIRSTNQYQQTLFVFNKGYERVKNG